jgi:hypothetical protein
VGSHNPTATFVPIDGAGKIAANEVGFDGAESLRSKMPL